MNNRTHDILKLIVSLHIKTQQPVASQTLAGIFEISSATIRNEMAELERDGYIRQPHTSAGRIPTENGYKFYIENHLNANKVTQKEREILKRQARQAQKEHNLKILAREISTLSQEAVFLSFGPHDIYITGLGYLFSKPEFFDSEYLTNICDIVDTLEHRIDSLFDQVSGVGIFIGSENPIADQLATIMFITPNHMNHQVFGLLGPLRMDYSKNYSILHYTQDLMTSTAD